MLWPDNTARPADSDEWRAASFFCVQEQNMQKREEDTVSIVLEKMMQQQAKDAWHSPEIKKSSLININPVEKRNEGPQRHNRCTYYLCFFSY